LSAVARLAVAVMAVLAAACAATPIDSVPDEATGRGYRVGMTLELRSDLLLEKPTGTLSGAPPNLVRESLRSAERSVTIDDYRRSRAAFPDIIGIVARGTRVVVTGIERRTYPGLDAWFEVKARIATGAFAGQTVSLDPISAHGADGRSPLVDPAELAIVE
jgi:hypothetical protein